MYFCVYMYVSVSVCVWKMKLQLLLSSLITINTILFDFGNLLDVHSYLSFGIGDFVNPKEM